MRPQPVTGRSANRDRFRVQLDRFRPLHRRSSTMFGMAEILALGGAVIMLVIVLVGYFYFLLPSRSRVDSLTSDRNRLEQELRFSRDNINRNQSTKVTVEKITESLERFEGRGLVERDEGRMGLYEDLNQLIHKNGLRNSSGPTYTALEPLGTKKQAAGAANAAAKWQSIYPGIAVSVTVEGQYQDIRHFVRDLEGSKQFLVINSMELERAESSNVRIAPDVSGARSGAANTLVSLRMDLATYFQRANGASEANPEPSAKVH